MTEDRGRTPDEFAPEEFAPDEPEPAEPEPAEPEPAPPADRDDGGSAPASAGPSSRRPMIERVGMAGIALVLAALFGGVAVAAFSGGEIFLAAMGAIGCLMTLWVGGLTLFRG